MMNEKKCTSPMLTAATGNLVNIKTYQDNLINLILTRCFFAAFISFRLFRYSYVDNVAIKFLTIFVLQCYTNVLLLYHKQFQAL